MIGSKSPICAQPPHFFMAARRHTQTCVDKKPPSMRICRHSTSLRSSLSPWCLWCQARLFSCLCVGCLLSDDAAAWYPVRASSYKGKAPRKGGPYTQPQLPGCSKRKKQSYRLEVGGACAREQAGWLGKEEASMHVLC